MSHVIVPPSWRLAPGPVTPEAVWLDRRRFLAGLGAVAAAPLAAGPLAGCRVSTAKPAAIPTSYAYTLPPITRNPRYTDGGEVRPITDEAVAGAYNNFYEYGADKADVWRRVGTLRPRPWTLTVAGACNKPGTFDLDSLLARMPLEERVYRFRCVEAWSMVVPWTGFPLQALLDLVEPLGSAAFVRFVTLDDPLQMPGIAEQAWYPWPYYEGLTMAEASNELALLAVGCYGHPLPNQHGAPIRLLVPWKYGYKNIKSIVRIELLDHKPPTFWNDLAPEEYGFTGNVDPSRPHPRWSQASERMLPTGERFPTLPFNGYGEQVAALYR